MPADLIVLAVVAAALIGAGFSVRAQAAKKDRYFLLAQEAGFKPEDVEISYESYRSNKLAIANLLLWVGVGLIVAGLFRAWYAIVAA